jgi:hypothetical protein
VLAGKTFTILFAHCLLLFIAGYHLKLLSEIRGPLYTFIVKQKADLRGRNPQTGESLTIEARRILTFKPSNLLRDAINA